MRKLASGVPQNTGDNAADFAFISTTGDAFGGSVQSILGTPGPEELRSHIQRNTQMQVSLVDPLQSPSAPVNRYRDSTPGDPVKSQYGTLSFRRRITNNTGQPVTALRFRIVDLTTLNSPNTTGGTLADLRVLSSSDISVTRADGSVVQVKGTTLPQEPMHPFGGGLNSNVNAGTVTLDAPLPAGQAINVQFLVGVQRGGNFSFYFAVEAQLPPVSPVVKITNPTNGNSLTTTNLIIDAEASSSGNSISKVEFFQGDAKLDEDTIAPYTFMWSGVAPGRYTLTARATDSSGAVATSTPISVTVNAPDPNAPSNLEATAFSDSQIDLYWTDNTNNETGFKIERKLGIDGTYEQVATVGPDITTFSDNNLIAGTLYVYRVNMMYPEI